ncbi:protein GVQW3-like [Daktulosphaira vitifoliae]|uniref:protein GVQW3-like n=1 Tax=Daktulosphaira vitifoliae TaxID=58002 RepID=UPI0021AA6A66|nr:protein GVQW3-like [Daktulosphaira vitifoliae]
MAKNTVQAKKWLEKCYGESAPSDTTIKRWYAEFKRGRRDTDDAERSGRPNEAITPENIEKIHKIVLNDRKMKLCQLANVIKISKERIGFILHENLSMKKLCSKWVPCLLTVEQKQQLVDDSK